MPASEKNTIPAWSWQHGMAEVIDAVATAGLIVERVREYPYSNGCKLHPALVPGPGRTWVWPPDRRAAPAHVRPSSARAERRRALTR